MDSESTSIIPYEQSVFINCPFDKDYLPLLKAMLWLLHRCGLRPRLSLERSNAGEGRLEKICELIDASKYGIHDLSRIKSSKKKELYRLNMPFELGIDYGYMRVSANSQHQQKVLLVLEGERYSAQKGLSDIAFADPQAHENDVEILIEVLREWLVVNGFKIEEGPTGLWDLYNAFYTSLTINLLSKGWKQKGINKMPIKEFLDHLSPS